MFKISRGRCGVAQSYSLHLRARSIRVSRGAEGDVDCRVSVVDDMVSLCIRQEGVFRKARRIRRIQARESGLDDAERPLNAIKFESKSDSSIPYHFPVRCKPY